MTDSEGDDQARGPSPTSRLKLQLSSADKEIEELKQHICRINDENQELEKRFAFDQDKVKRRHDKTSTRSKELFKSSPTSPARVSHRDSPVKSHDVSKVDTPTRYPQHRHNSNLKLRKFKTLSYSHPHPTEWLEEMEEYVYSTFDREYEAVLFVVGLLERDIKNEIRIHHNFREIGPDSLFREIRLLFTGIKTPEMLRQDFESRTQTKSETCREYAVKLVDMMVTLKGMKEIDTQTTESMLRNRFSSGVLSTQLKRRFIDMLYMHPDYTFAQLRKIAESKEETSSSDFTSWILGCVCC